MQLSPEHEFISQNVFVNEFQKVDSPTDFFNLLSSITNSDLKLTVLWEN